MDRFQSPVVVAAALFAIGVVPAVAAGQGFEPVSAAAASAPDRLGRIAGIIRGGRGLLHLASAVVGGLGLVVVIIAASGGE